MNAERTTPPQHRDPRAKAGLTGRRRRLGLPVGREGLAGPHYFDSTGKRELGLGDRITDGEDTWTILELRDEGNGEGGYPQIIASHGDGPVVFDTLPKNYRAEGPDWPENWVCDEVAAVNP